MRPQQVNGFKAVQNGDAPGQSVPTQMSDDQYAVLGLRNLLFDICNQNGGGHGGSAIGMAAIGVALYKYAMRYNPSNPEWFDRDRFVLSNGEYSRYRSLHIRFRATSFADARQAMRPCFSTLSTIWSALMLGAWRN
jgi:hypothetical protein